MNRTITILVTEFLKERRESHGGWAQITDEDTKALNDIIDHLITEKCEPDPDQDFPWQVLVIDKRKYKTMFFRPLPHDKDFIDNEKHGQPLEEVMRIAELNLGIAHEAFETEFKMWLHRKEQEAKRTLEMSIVQAAAKMKPGDQFVINITHGEKKVGKKTLTLRSDDTFDVEEDFCSTS